MNRRKTSRSAVALTTAVMVAALVSVSSLTMIHTLSVDATRPRHNDNDNSLAQQLQPVPQSLGSSPNSGSADSDIAGSGEFAMQQIQLQQQAASSNAACGQVVSGVVNLTANLNCSGDGIIVGGPNTVINMNGFSITGPGQDSSKVAIMVPNVDNVVVNGPGSLSNFQAGVLLTGANGFKISSVILSDNQIGTFMTGADNAQVQQNIIQGNSIGVASHSSTGAAYRLKPYEWQLAGRNNICQHTTIQCRNE